MVERVGRVFAAVSLPEEVRLAVRDAVRPLDLPGRVAPVENLHMTLRFLGSIDHVTYERFMAAMDGTLDIDPFKVRLGPLGAFPRPSRATVVWMGADRGEQELALLAEHAEEAAQAAGLDAEERPFRAHLTLSRVRPPEDVRAIIAAFEPRDIGFRCQSVTVYRSHTGRGGARYEPLDTLPLSR